MSDNPQESEVERSDDGLYYQCPYCGERVILGSHVCEREPVMPRGRSKKPGTADGRTNQRRIAFQSSRAFRWGRSHSAIAVLLLAIFLWRFIGPLALIPLGITLIMLYTFPGRISPAGNEAEGLFSSPLHQLYIRVGNDEKLARRLMDEERRRRPGKSKRWYARMALKRWERQRER
jgi:DNA-directed RNA polymerase subunit RPC12/RpoP